MEWLSIVLLFVGGFFFGYFLLLTKKVNDIRSLFPEAFTRHIIWSCYTLLFLFFLFLIANTVLIINQFF